MPRTAWSCPMHKPTKPSCCARPRSWESPTSASPGWSTSMSRVPRQGIISSPEKKRLEASPSPPAPVFYVRLPVVLRRQFVHRLEESLGVFGIDFRRDTVAEIEHMACAMAVGREDACNFSADRCGAGIKHRRVHVALQRHLATHPRPGTADVAGPVEAQRFGADI